MRPRDQKQAGAVSLFIVVFACLTVTIITVGFVSVMIRGQQQATDTDLANSAYDSAIAGVEDAKRLTLLYRDCDNKGILDSDPSCQAIRDAVEDEDCDSVQQGLGIGTTEEVLVKSSEDDSTSEQLNQAYTCVTIDYTPDDYVGEMQQDTTRLIELRGTGSYNAVRISWHLRAGNDTTTPGSMATPTAPLSTADKDLPASTYTWQETTPAIMRAQFIQTKTAGFTLAQFNDTPDAGRNSSAVFLYPNIVSTANAGWPDSVNLLAADPALSTNPTTPKEPSTIRCRQDSYADGDYACSALITLPNPKGGASRANAYLALSSFYNDADFRIELVNASGANVSFNGVQPAIDSTGRANDLFRRVDARIEFTSDLSYPNAALDLADTLCKTFAVTDNASDFQPGTCNP